jgi:hypothetical protein
MIEPPIAGEMIREQPLAPLADDLVTNSAPGGAQSAAIETGRAACLRFARTSTFVSWGLLALGIVAGLERVVSLAIDGDPKSGSWGRACAGAVFSILAYGLAGLAWAALARMTAAAISEYLDRVASASADLLALAARGVADLDRIADILADGRGPQMQIDQTALDRTNRLDEIRRAIRTSQWAHAQSLLGAFAAEFPDDSRQPALESELHQARHNARQQHSANLEAAREVNDPDRVLDCYELLVGAIDSDARAALDRDLGKWFLALIHRRLRATKIQPDVVQLAARFAQAFASTVEGASVRAALPTLRRSIGLCPRCGSPYGGVGDACPKCLDTISLHSGEPESGDQPIVP